MGFLATECVPPMTRDAAAELWSVHFDRSSSLPQRSYEWQRLPLDSQERNHACEFMTQIQRLTGSHNEIVDVVKVDLRELITIQSIVAMERSRDYLGMQVSESAWRDEFLPIDSRPPQIGMRYAIGYPYHDHPCHTTIIYDLPSAEFAFLPQSNGSFAITETPRHVIACRKGETLVLRNGHHRCLARILASAASEAPTAILAIADYSAGDARAEQQLSANHSGLPPATLADYVTEGLYIDVHIRRKRYQIEVQARWRSFNDE